MGQFLLVPIIATAILDRLLRTALDFPEEELTIIVLASRTDLDVSKLALQATDLMDAREVAPRN